MEINSPSNMFFNYERKNRKFYSLIEKQKKIERGSGIVFFEKHWLEGKGSNLKTYTLNAYWPWIGGIEGKIILVHFKNLIYKKNNLIFKIK